MEKNESHLQNEKLNERSNLEGQYAFEFGEGQRKGKWLQISNETGIILEGAHFVPEKGNNGEVVVFHPGLPGDAVSWFEERDVPRLLQEGYEVFTARHRGLLSSEGNKIYFNNEKRRSLGTNETSAEVSVDDWLQEPKTALQYFSNKPVTLITHSFSALAGQSSLVQLQEQYGDSAENPLNGLKKWLILGGITHDLKEGGVTDKAKDITLETWVKFFEWLHQSGIYKMEGAESAMHDFERALKTVNKEIGIIPKHIKLISVVAEGDKYVSLEAAHELQAHLGQGLVIDDKTFDKEQFPEGVDPHDFPHMNPETMLRLIQMRISQYPHTATVTESEKQPTVKLTSSEILQKKFGELSIEILFQNELHRESCLRLKGNDVAIACSVVDFNQSGISIAPDLHANIVAGSLLGKTIQGSGIDYERKEFQWETNNIPTQFQSILNTTETSCLSRKIEYFIKGELYATIMEYYNPDYVDKNDFKS